MRNQQETDLQDEVLEDLGSAVRYTAWLAALCEPWLGDHPLEVGSGTGVYAEHWRRPGRRIEVSEAVPARVAALRDRYADEDDVSARQLTAPVEETADYSAVVALNVLEHIDDHVGALRSFAGLVRPGGHVVMVAPAFPIAMSEFDRAIGHYRRYRRASMRAAFVEAGLERVEVRYVNSIGLLGWLVMVTCLRGRPRDGLPLRVYDRCIVPVLRRVEARWAPPFGQSVLGVGRVVG